MNRTGKLWTGRAVCELAYELTDNHYEGKECVRVIADIESTAPASQVTEQDVAKAFGNSQASEMLEADWLWECDRPECFRRFPEIARENAQIEAEAGEDDYPDQGVEAEEPRAEEPVETREPKYSEVVDARHGVVRIDCSECSRGGNGGGKDSCPYGGDIKTPQRHGCNNGKLLRGLQFKKETKS